jgi:hypothetical protein
MPTPHLRFDLVLDPTDHWTVWDHDVETPACFGGEILHGLSESQAQQFAKILNEIYPSSLMARKNNSTVHLRKTPFFG